MDRSRLGHDLKETLQFQCAFAEVVCACLDVRFIDNDLISHFKILNHINMPSRQIGLQNWEGMIELEKLLAHWVRSLPRRFKISPLH